MKILASVRREVPIGEVARLCGLTPRAIRLYEDRGLVSTRRTERGVRLYSAQEIERLEFIARARRAGLSISDIGLLVTLEESQGKAARSARMATLCRQQLKVLEAKQLEIGAILTELGRASAPAPRVASGPRTLRAGAEPA